MLDVGWTEILVIAIVLIIVVGPKDLPQMLRTFGRIVTKMRGMASDFPSSSTRRSARPIWTTSARRSARRRSSTR